MGGEFFTAYAHGKDPQSAFQSAVEEARYQCGHGGYTGTIAEKDGYTVRSRTPMSPKAAEEFAEQDGQDNEKWGPAYAVPVSKSRKTKEHTGSVSAKTKEEAMEKAKKKYPNALIHKVECEGKPHSLRIKSERGRTGRPKIKYALEGLDRDDAVHGNNRFDSFAEAKKAAKGVMFERIARRFYTEEWRLQKNWSRINVVPVIVFEGAGEGNGLTMHRVSVGINDKNAKWTVYYSKEKAGDEIDGWLFYGWASS